MDTLIAACGKNTDSSKNTDAERGILVADTGSALNGPNRDEDPCDKGYLYDGIHENDEGAKVVADVFRKLGYDLIIP